MYHPLAPCPACNRHVRTIEPSCPFCGVTLGAALTPAPDTTQRLGRAAAFVFGATLALAGCASSTGTSETGPSQDSGPMAQDSGPMTQDSGPADDGAPVALYGAPAPLDAGPDDNGGGMAEYGAPPPQDGGGGGARYGAPPPPQDAG